jgi:hypothetical protein
VLENATIFDFCVCKFQKSAEPSEKQYEKHSSDFYTGDPREQSEKHSAHSNDNIHSTQLAIYTFC